MKVKTKYYIGESLIILGLILLIIAVFIDNEFWFYTFGISGLLISISGEIVQIIFWKCPNCSKHLPPRYGQEYCPFCGEEL